MVAIPERVVTTPVLKLFVLKTRQVWIDSYGVEHDLASMTDQHLRNARDQAGRQAELAWQHGDDGLGRLNESIWLGRLNESIWAILAAEMQRRDSDPGWPSDMQEVY